MFVSYYLILTSSVDSHVFIVSSVVQYWNQLSAGLHSRPVKTTHCSDVKKFTSKRQDSTTEKTAVKRPGKIN